MGTDPEVRSRRERSRTCPTGRCSGDCFVAADDAIVLRLLGDFMLRRGDRCVDVSTAGARVLAFLTLAGAPVARARVAGALWPDRSDGRAQANLRVALWRLREAGADLVVRDDHRLALRPSLRSDYAELKAWAERLVCGRRTSDDLAVDPVDVRVELLADWSDDWVLVERERVRQWSLAALEALGWEHLRAGRCARAVQAGLAAVVAEPLRESAHRVVVAAHLAEGNYSEAHHHYQRYRAQLEAELGVEPSDLFARMLTEGAVAARGRADQGRRRVSGVT